MSFYGHDSVPAYIRDIYNTLLGAWSSQTCAPRMRVDWSEHNPTLGQCSITSFLVQDMLGGEVWGILLPDGAYHCFNRVGGFEFDLTSEQFGGEALDYSSAVIQSREEHFSNEDKYSRYLILKENYAASAAINGMCGFIRPARPEDAERLAEIEVFNYRLNFYPIFRTDRYFFSELNVSAVADEYRACPERIADTMVCDDGVIKGFVRVKGEEIEKLFVEPAFQNEGIGGTLFRYAADEMGGRRLLVLEKNPGAISLYERFGFVRTDKRQRVDDTEEMFVVMERVV